MQPDPDGIGRDAEDLSRFGLAETIPHEQAEQFLVVGPHSGQRFQGWRLDRMDRRGCPRLCPQSEREFQATARAPMLVGDNATGDRQKPGQGCVHLGKTAHSAPGNREGLGHRVLGIGLQRRASEGVGKDRAVMLLEGGLEAAEGWGTHIARDGRGPLTVPAY